MPLLAVEGDPFNNATKGVMRPTPQLEGAARIWSQVLAALDADRAHPLDADRRRNAEATEHVDVNHYWQQRMRCMCRS